MSVQLTYGQTPAVGFDGMLAEQFSLKQIDSGIVEGSVIGLGRPVKTGTLDGQYELCVADDAVAGVAVFATQGVESQTVFEYADQVQFPVLSKGRYYAIAGATLAIGAEVAYNISTGRVQAVSAGNTTLEYATVRTAAVDGDLVIVEVRF